MIIIEEESRKKGLELNSKKTGVLIVRQNNESTDQDLINENKLKQTAKVSIQILGYFNIKRWMQRY